MSDYKKHQELIKKFKLDAYDEIPGIRIFDRHVGLFYRKNGTPIRINKPGMADAYAIIPFKFGLLHVEIEFKTGSAKQTKQQITWQKFIEAKGGIYLLVREDYHNSIQELKNRVESLTN